MDTHRLKRCVKLLELFHSDGRRDAKALAKMLGVSRRTVFRDLKLIKEAIGDLPQPRPTTGKGAKS